MPEEDNKILKYNHGEKSMRAPFVIYADFERSSEKINACDNDPEKSTKAKINEHTPSGYSLFACNSFGAKVDKPDCYRGKGCLKKFIKDFKKRVIRIINYEEKEMIPLTKKSRKCIIRQKLVTYVKKDLVLMLTMKSIIDHCHYTGKCRGAAHNICNLRYKTPREIPVIFHNDSTYDYHLIIKELSK